MENKTINYLGKTLNTDFYYDLSIEKCEQLKNDFYEKPHFNEVQKELISICKGGTKTSNITQYYLKSVMSKVKFHHSKWSLEEVFNCNDLIKVLYGKTTLNKKYSLIKILILKK